MNQKEYEDMHKEQRSNEIAGAISKLIVACIGGYNNPTPENLKKVDQREQELKDTLYMNLKD